MSNMGMTQPQQPDTRHPALPAILHVEGLCFAYPERTLFADWSASISPGVSLVRGGDGRGKTTLLRLLAGALPADAGRLQIQGIGLLDQAPAYRQQLFWVDPRTDAFDQMTPLEYLEAQRGFYPGFDEQMLKALIEGLALAPQMDKQLYMLSTGSKRKVWLAAAFASGAALTLLDMPFAALDKASIGFVLGLLQEAADHPARAWMVADYEAPREVRLSGLMDLGD
ncbi:ATP-binding cassette domain-containing protein [Polaromonas sp. UC242_47]|uniref:ABC transporter ATP-binding protein n=1 Tax=Polaromonas sp. UC242_47 TaxID=3374626 RepID=UPI0037ABD48A